MRSSLYGGLAVAAILTVGLVLVACGSSNDNNTSTTAALTKAQFDKQGNAICKKGNQQINKVANQTFTKKKYPNGPPPKSVQVKFATDTLIPNIQTEIDGIKALGAPKGDEAKVNAIVTSAQGALDQAKKDPTVLLQNGPGPFKPTNKLANAYGLTVCGSGGGGGGNGNG
jgi:uncharacterized protein with beta-barrel porin domain